MPEMVPVDPSPRITKARPRIVARLIGRLACAFQGSPALGQRPDCLDLPALVCESLHGILPAGWIGLSGRDCRQIVKSGPGANGVDRAGRASMLSDFSYLRALGPHAVKFGLCDSQNPIIHKNQQQPKIHKGDPSLPCSLFVNAGCDSLPENHNKKAAPVRRPLGVPSRVETGRVWGLFV